MNSFLKSMFISLYSFNTKYLRVHHAGYTRGAHIPKDFTVALSYQEAWWTTIILASHVIKANTKNFLKTRFH